ncbi:MAG TPA: DUF1598 domain-containing protein [Pirellulales bacterium]|jgi:hypothetical protein
MQPRILFFALGIGLQCVFGALAATPEKAAPPSDKAALLQAQLETGEFAPALQLAQQAQDKPERRDAMLAQIASAQAAEGQRRAALQTVAQIDDDRVANESLTNLRQQPLMPQGRFGGNQADFDSLIDLITSTIAAPTWSEMGGPGDINSFAGGVCIDASGVVRSLLKVDRSGGLAALRETAIKTPPPANSTGDARQASAMRKISLVRLERQVEMLAAQGRRPTEEMQTLAGMQRIQYVMVYPEQGDIVLAGPAGDWETDREGRLVGKESNHPVLRLDDFVVVLRQMMSGPAAPFGCNITPTTASLADVKAFVAESNKAPLKPGQRDGWLKTLREKLGRQDIEVYGIEPRTRVGLVLVEADYRMKLIGMGLEDGVLDVPSYLSMITVPPGKAAPPMDVLRWWFTLNYEAVVATPKHNAFELHGQGVRVQSENEMLTAAGQQVHTGKSNPLNDEFAHNFTKHFSELAVKYPIYAELQNICDLALAAALMRNEKLPEKARWHMLDFGNPEKYAVPLENAPKSVETVLNHRVVNGNTIIVGVSGGVRVDPSAYVKPAAIKTDDYGLLEAQRSGAAPKKDDRTRWWWD